MKKLLLIVFTFLSLISSHSFAQLHVKREPLITFGGITGGSNVSIMQLMDYPELMMTDKTEQIVSYEITFNAGKEESVTIKVEGPKINQAAKAKLESLKGKEGEIRFQHVMTKKEDVIFDTPYQLTLHFNQ